VSTSVIQCERAWPWGLAAVGDPNDRERVPTEFGDAQVLATAGTVVIRIQHEADGEATVEVVLGDPPDGLTLVHRGSLSLSSGELVVTDARREQESMVQVVPGRYEVGVWVDEPPDPAIVVVALNDQ